MHPAGAAAEFVWRMEDVLDVYAEPYDPSAPAGLLRREPQATGRRDAHAAAGRPGPARARYDYEYERNGTANLFLLRPAARLAARRRDRPPHRARLRRSSCGTWSTRTSRRRRGIRARPGQPEHPHPGRALRGVPARRGPADRREAGVPLHPKHGSWLNMAEFEFSVLRASAWTAASATATPSRPRSPPGTPRNEHRATIHWHFTAADARASCTASTPHIHSGQVLVLLR